MDKPKLRAELSSRIAALDESYLSQSSRAILEKLLLLPEFKSARRVFAYYSVDREVDTRPLIAYCLASGLPLALPRTEPNRSMSFALVTSADELSHGPFGIPEPSVTLPAVSPRPDDLIVVPALCYDLQGFRMGHGGGYYDRFLADCPAFTVGLCREALLSRALPTEPHDLPVRVVITEKKIARPLRVSLK